VVSSPRAADRQAKPKQGRRTQAAAGPPPAQPAVARYRLRYAKLGNLRYLSHLDTVRALGRAFRRAGLPLALSGGFNPQPKVAYGTALAVGLESEAEYVDIELLRPLPAAEVARLVSNSLPPSLELRELHQIPLGRPALQSYPAVSSYVVRPAAGHMPDQELLAALPGRIEAMMAKSTLPVTRHKGKTADIRRYVLAVDLAGLGGGAGQAPALKVQLGSDNAGAGRVDEVLAALGLDPERWRVLRTDFWPLVAGHKTSPWQC